MTSRSWHYLALEKYDLAIADRTGHHCARQFSNQLEMASECAARKGDTKGVIEDLTQALPEMQRAKARRTPFCIVCALTYKKLGDRDRAIVDLNEGLETAPNDEALLVDRAEIFGKRGFLISPSRIKPRRLKQTATNKTSGRILFCAPVTIR